MRRRTLAWLLLLAMTLGLLGGCSAPSGAEQGGGKLRIVCTIFPLYDWVRQLLGARAADVELTLLLDQGTDLHSYQPSADDIITISGCDLLVYVGGPSDQWVTDALRESQNREMVVLNLMELLGSAVREEETVEGMEPEAGEEEAEYDEHVWLSLKNAAVVCGKLSETLGALMPGSVDLERNTAAYLAELDALDARYQAAADAGAVKTLLFGDRFPFRYLVEDYGLDYYAAFAGCSAETEASFETIVFLADKVDELGLKTILQTESSDGSIPNTIRQTTAAKDQQILTLDSMQSVTAADIDAGATYLSVMEQNLTVLSQALSNQ